MLCHICNIFVSIGSQISEGNCVGGRVEPFVVLPFFVLMNLRSAMSIEYALKCGFFIRISNSGGKHWHELSHTHTQSVQTIYFMHEPCTLHEHIWILLDNIPRLVFHKIIHCHLCGNMILCFYKQHY